MENQTIKVDIKVYVGLDKYQMDSYYEWNPNVDSLSADETAQAILEHVKIKMASALEPCFYDHIIGHETKEQTHES